MLLPRHPHGQPGATLPWHFTHEKGGAEGEHEETDGGEQWTCDRERAAKDQRTKAKSDVRRERERTPLQHATRLHESEAHAHLHGAEDATEDCEARDSSSTESSEQPRTCNRRAQTECEDRNGGSEEVQVHIAKVCHGVCLRDKNRSPPEPAELQIRKRERLNGEIAEVSTDWLRI